MFLTKGIAYYVTGLVTYNLYIQVIEASIKARSLPAGYTRFL